MFAKVSSLFGDKSKNTSQKSVRKAVRRTRQVLKQEEQKEVRQVENFPTVAKELFWRKYPHYPEMNSAYRMLLQKLKIDNSRAIKVHDARCGTDLCQIAAGIGPNVDYCCTDENAPLIDKNIKKFQLGNKTERIIENIDGSKGRLYSAHLMSFEPTSGDDRNIDWDLLAENTLSGGYIIVPRIIKDTQEIIKPSQKLADNIEFYFCSKIDHTAHWVSVLEERFELLKNADPKSMMDAGKNVIKLFGVEATKWAMDLKRLKTGDVKILSMIYKRDDVND